MRKFLKKGLATLTLAFAMAGCNPDSHVLNKNPDEPLNPVPVSYKIAGWSCIAVASAGITFVLTRPTYKRKDGPA